VVTTWYRCECGSSRSPSSVRVPGLSVTSSCLKTRLPPPFLRSFRFISARAIVLSPFISSISHFKPLQIWWWVTSTSLQPSPSSEAAFSVLISPACLPFLALSNTNATSTSLPARAQAPKPVCKAGLLRLWPAVRGWEHSFRAYCPIA
jgi:hypothetical protein